MPTKIVSAKHPFPFLDVLILLRDISLALCSWLILIIYIANPMLFKIYAAEPNDNVEM